MLCSMCESTITSGETEGHHYEYVQDFLSAVEAGCYICAILLEGIQHRGCVVSNSLSYARPFLSYDKQDSAEWYHPSLFFKCSAIYIWTTLIITLTPARDFSTSTSIPEFRREPPLEARGVDNLICHSTGDEEVTKRAQWWLEKCRRTHITCDRYRNPRYYPLRLLDLSGDFTRLILSNVEEPRGAYATLSHCWGPNPSHITLTADNLSSFRQKISENFRKSRYFVMLTTLVITFFQKMKKNSPISVLTGVVLHAFNKRGFFVAPLCVIFSVRPIPFWVRR